MSCQEPLQCFQQAIQEKRKVQFSEIIRYLPHVNIWVQFQHNDTARERVTDKWIQSPKSYCAHGPSS